MKFEEAVKETKGLERKKAKPDASVKASKKNTTIKDPGQYPKENMYAWDTGITDRGPTGFTGDINALIGKEKIGHSKITTYTNYKSYKKGE